MSSWNSLKLHVLTEYGERMINSGREWDLDYWAELSNPYRPIDWKLDWAKRMLDGMGEIRCH